MNTLIDSSSLQETEDILILILSLFLFILQSNFVVCYSISIFNAFSLQGAKNKQKKSICSLLQQYSFLLQHTKSRSLIPVYVQIALTSSRRPDLSKQIAVAILDTTIYKTSSTLEIKTWNPTEIKKY